MSSATSIKRAAGAAPLVEPSANGPDASSPGTAADAGFRPWHFFVLASLMAATAAVVLSRRATPEHLVFISITIGAAGSAAAALYRALAPLAAPDAEAFREPLSDRAREALAREKALALRSLKELEFDQAMGKLSPRDFEEMSGRLRARALSLMRQLDEGGSGYRAVIERELQARMAGQTAAAVLGRPAAPAMADGDVVEPVEERLAPACPGCGTVNDQDAAFCKRCGQRVA
ncbi:MAG TPA: zinc ribbon domain-containing protein [Ardenticatenaceae bacterium]|nr:zinc ribbon domain-containing protein [Ardenticatenaceae bacterium]